MILRDFECHDCHSVFEALVKSGENSCDCKCGGNASVVYIKAPGLEGVESFTPHFDYQLGEHFQSKDEKEVFLKKHGRSQVSGRSSPRKTTGTSVVCTKDQGKRLRMNKKEKKHGSNHSLSGN